MTGHERRSENGSPSGTGSPRATGSTGSALDRISAFIICLNERNVLEACLDSLAGMREIVIVDSGSTDGTLDVIADYRARGWPIRLFHNDWPGFAAQKQFALDQCSHEWCFSIDSDERLTADLRLAISNLPLERPGKVAYAVARLDWLPGYGYAARLVHTHHHTRLFRKSEARFELGALLHEGLLFKGTVVKLSVGRLLHYRNMSIAQEIGKADRYATLKAREKRAGGERAGYARMVLRPLWRFGKSYVLQRYFLCGTPGFVYSAMLGVYVFLTEAKLFRMQAGAKVPDET